MEITDWIQAVAAVATLGAAIAAVIIAAKAPRLAAKFADDFRKQSAADEDHRRFQMLVFTSLMKCRRELMNQDARAAVNLVDVAFSEYADVINARRLFIEATVGGTPEMIVERYHALTEAVSRAMGFNQYLTGQDVRTGWYPEGLSKIDLATILEAEEKLARLGPKASVADA